MQLESYQRRAMATSASDDVINPCRCESVDVDWTKKNIQRDEDDDIDGVALLARNDVKNSAST